MSTSEKKKGRLSREEESIIIENLPSMSDEEIAAIINRTPDIVAKYRTQAPVLIENSDAGAVIAQLHKKFFWPETRNQLITTEEVEYFERYWASLVAQFAHQGILGTDEMMMRDLILADININRSLKNKANALRDIENLEKAVEQAYADFPTDVIQRLNVIQPLKEQINSIRGAMKSLSDEWKILQEKKDRLNTALKTTRQQRLEKVENAKQNFFDLVKQLDEPDVREKEGRLAAMLASAAQLARQRFQQLTTYEDGKVDRPFLTPEAEKEG